MLSFIVLVSTTGQPLRADAVARCTAPPTNSLTFRPVAATTWRSDEGHVVVAAWADRPGGWHVGRHGVTLTTSTPWPLASRFTAPSGVTFELTDRLGDGTDPGSLGWLTGAATVVRARPDGSGLIGAPPTGGGTCHVAHGEGVVAIADRAAVAAAGAGGRPRRHDLPGLLRGTLLDREVSVAGVERLGPGAHLLLQGRHGTTTVDGGTPWTDDVDESMEELAAAAADDVARLLELAGGVAGQRTVELGADPGSLVVAAALAATSGASGFSLRASDDHGRAPAAALASELDAVLTDPRRHDDGGTALDARVRAAVARTAANVSLSSAHTGSLTGLRDDGADVVVAATPGGPLSPDPGPTGRRLLTTRAAATLDAVDAEWREGRGRVASTDEAGAVVAELDRRGPLRQRAAADLVGGATVLDPLAVPSVARLAVAASRAGADATTMLVGALHPPMLAHRAGHGGNPPAAPSRDWRELATVLEAHVLGHARDELGEVLDLDEVATVVRSGTPPDRDTWRTLEGALTLAVWAARTDVHVPSPGVVVARPPVTVPDQLPILVTGVTSTSLLELTGLAVPLDATDVDAMLGVRADREVRDLVLELLLAVDAAPGHLPADLDARLGGIATAHLAGPARSLLTRRGGTLADPRLALTLPFWEAHVGPPRVVLVAERPPDLASRSPSALPTIDLLGWWVDAMTAAAASTVDVRVVDPGDLAEDPLAEAIGWSGLDDDDNHDGDGGDDDVEDLLRVVRTVDSLVREVELDAARPLLRTIRTARAEEREDQSRPPVAAAAPLHVVDELWERAVQADERLAAQRAGAEALEEALAGLRTELDELRERRGLKAAWATLRGRT